MFLPHETKKSLVSTSSPCIARSACSAIENTPDSAAICPGIPVNTSSALSAPVIATLVFATLAALSIILPSALNFSTSFAFLPISPPPAAPAAAPIKPPCRTPLPIPVITSSSLRAACTPPIAPS